MIGRWSRLLFRHRDWAVRTVAAAAMVASGVAFVPVFFIQDAMKFADLIHAVKPEPHNGMPQAASAHDTFWDFASLSPETTHTLMWVMSDRGIPRSLRMMQGFGVHTFRLVNAEGESHFVKFHRKPLLGTHSLVWDEAVKIAGADADFHRRDLWEAIEAGEYPEWELGLQIFTEAQAEGFSFDVLDATKLIPEELVPVTPVGRMVLNRNPDNFFGAGCDKLRGKPEKFADHYTQATLFYESQTAVEKAHIAGGFRFELSKLTVPAIRERMVSSLVNVSAELAASVAEGVGIAVPKAMPRALEHPTPPEVTLSKALSLTALPGDGGIRTRQIAILAAHGVAGKSIASLRVALAKAGAVSYVIAPRLGAIETEDGVALAATHSFENSAPVLFDAVVLPDGKAGVALLAGHGQATDFVVNQYRHGKTILALGAAKALLAKAGISAQLPSGDADPGVLQRDANSAAAAAFIEAIAKHRHPARESDPPPI